MTTVAIRRLDMVSMILFGFEVVVIKKKMHVMRASSCATGSAVGGRGPKNTTSVSKRNTNSQART